MSFNTLQIEGQSAERICSKMLLQKNETILPELTENILGSIPRLLQVIIRANGKHTKYLKYVSIIYCSFDARTMKYFEFSVHNFCCCKKFIFVFPSI